MADKENCRVENTRNDNHGRKCRWWQCRTWQCRTNQVAYFLAGDNRLTSILTVRRVCSTKQLRPLCDVSCDDTLSSPEYTYLLPFRPTLSVHVPSSPTQLNARMCYWCSVYTHLSVTVVLITFIVFAVFPWLSLSVIVMSSSSYLFTMPELNTKYRN